MESGEVDEYPNEFVDENLNDDDIVQREFPSMVFSENSFNLETKFQMSQ